MRMKDQSLKIIEDWERESLKDLVYLQEEITLMQQEVDKQPAMIQVIDKDKILNRRHEHQNDVLPF
jgi:hypothetical protein